MATKKKSTVADVPEPTPKTPPNGKAKVEVDWGKGFTEHHDAVVTGNSIKVPIPFSARRALGGSQTKSRYDHVRVKLDGKDVSLGERRFHKAPSEDLPSLTLEVLEKE